MNGQPVKAVAQVSKQGFVYVFDRVTGKPIWPIEERPVPQSMVPGETIVPDTALPDQARALRPAGNHADDLIDFTPDLRKQALAVLEKYNYGPLFTPPLSGEADDCDARRRRRRELGGCGVRPRDRDLLRLVHHAPRSQPRCRSRRYPTSAMSGGWLRWRRWQGIPLWKPPYGRITAIDLNTGDHRWMTPVGDLADLAKENSLLRQLGLSSLGRAARGHLLLTKTLLIVGQEGNTQREEAFSASPAPRNERAIFEVHDPKLVAYDKTTGKVVGEVALPRNATGAPMTYMLNGKQFIVVPTGGANLPAELIALRLP